jgi:hypothetical protein
MFYIGITVKGDKVDKGDKDKGDKDKGDKDKGDEEITYLQNTGLYFENGIIYARKGTTAESLLIPSWELETIKGHIRRLPLEIYQRLNDDFGVHCKTLPRPIIKKRV